MQPDLARLSAQLGYEFNNPQLLDAALTHRSIQGENNERLEFLGDSIVNFIIAEALYFKFPNAREGDLTRFRANFVRGETLAQLAMHFSIGDYLHLGPGELKSGGYRRASILADAMEAIIAAIYLDAGFETCRKKVLQWYDKLFTDFALIDQHKDAKTRLQELLQSQKKSLPTYVVKQVSGEAHQQVFHVDCYVPGLEGVTSGSGPSIRRAEQQAAEKYLKLLQSQE